MKAKIDRTENRITYIIVEPKASDVAEYIDKAYDNLRSKVDVPGYAKGKATRKAIDQHVTKDRILKEAIKALGYEKYPVILKEKGIRESVQPVVTVLQNEPAKFELAVPLEPIVELCDYRKMEVPPASLEVSEEEVNNIIDKSRLKKAEHKPVDRPAQEGDLVEMDVEGYLGSKLFMIKKQLRARLTPEFAPELPGLYKKIAGAKKGEEKRFKLKIPDEHKTKSMAGKETEIRVTVHDIREVILPEINDEFAKSIASGVESLNELRERVRYNRRKEKEREEETNYKERVVEALIANSRIEYPPQMIEIQTRLLAKEYYDQLRTSCKDNREYEDKCSMMTEETVKESMKPLAQKRVLWSLVLDEVARLEKVVVESSEITGKIDAETAGLKNEERTKVRRYLQRIERKNVEDLVKASKTINRLTQIVKENNCIRQK